MFSHPSNPAQAYSSTGVSSAAMSASPHGLVLMLYEGAMLAVSAARMHMQLGQKAEKSRAISKAIAIISDGLIASLDTRAGGEIAESLLLLYQYMIEKLSEANARNLPDPLEEVGRLLADLNDAWKSIARTPAAQAAVVAAGT